MEWRQLCDSLKICGNFNFRFVNFIWDFYQRLRQRTIIWIHDQVRKSNSKAKILDFFANFGLDSFTIRDLCSCQNWIAQKKKSFGDVINHMDTIFFSFLTKFWMNFLIFFYFLSTIFTFLTIFKQPFCNHFYRFLQFIDQFLSPFCPFGLLCSL